VVVVGPEELEPLGDVAALGLHLELVAIRPNLPEALH
jgi:hypothetical protein